jgi:hypothetical protein
VGDILKLQRTKIIGLIALSLVFSLLMISCNQISLFRKELDRKGVKYLIETRAGFEHDILKIEHKESDSENSILERQIDRKIYAAEISDLDMNGVPEIYVYGKSNDSDEYGDVFCFTLKDDGSLTEVFVPTLDPYISNGYMGHDQFSVSELFLNRQFRVPREISSEGVQKVKYALTKSSVGLFLNEITSGRGP